MNFIGIDQSLTATGISIISNKDWDQPHLTTVKPLAPDVNQTVRLAVIRDAVKEVLTDYAPAWVAIEGYNMGAGRFGRTFQLGEIGGILKLLTHDMRINTVIVSPAGLGAFALWPTGKKPKGSKAKKKAVLEAILERFGVSIKDHNQADAYVLSLMAMLKSGVKIVGGEKGKLTATRSHSYLTGTHSEWNTRSTVHPGSLANGKKPGFTG